MGYYTGGAVRMQALVGDHTVYTEHVSELQMTNCLAVEDLIVSF